MNKLLVTILISTMLSLHQCGLMGGAMPRPLTTEVHMKASKLLKAVTGDKLTSGSNQPELVYYASQVVAGTNFYMVYELQAGKETEYYCVVAFEALPVYGGKITLERYEKEESLGSACSVCRAVGEAENICKSKSVGLADSSL